MFDFTMLQEALNNPNSPMRDKLLTNLAMSPLDPAAAMQQLQPEMQDYARGGLPPTQELPKREMDSVVNGGPAQRFIPENATPNDYAPKGTGKGPWSFDYSGGNGAAAGDTGNPNFVPLAAASAAGMDPGASILPGETAGIPNGTSDLSKMLQGAGGGSGEDNYRPPQAPAPSLGSRWNPFQAEMLQTPGVNRLPSLAEILAQRR